MQFPYNGYIFPLSFFCFSYSCFLPPSTVLLLGKMLIVSTVFGNVNSVLALASALSIQSPLTQNAYRNSEAEDLRKPLESNHGDPITLLNFYKEWLTVRIYRQSNIYLR